MGKYRYLTLPELARFVRDNPTDAEAAEDLARRVLYEAAPRR